MLISCPECELQVSNKAINCPHCGYPMLTQSEIKRRPRQSRRKRLPNGFGQISEIKGRGLRRPFRAMICTGKTEDGKFVYKLLKPIAYFETYNDAYSALVEYHKNPYDISKDITMSELYDRWSEVHFRKLKSAMSMKNIRCVWAHCSGIYSMRVSEIRARHIKAMIEESNTSQGNKTLMKMVINMMMDYAVEYEIVDHNYARDFSIEKKAPTNGSHKTFTKPELATIMSHVGESKWIDMIAVQCYSGWRPQELCRLLISDIDLVGHSITGGSKTTAGIGRKVPIHDKVYDIIKRYATESRTSALFGDITYEQYRYAFHKELKRIGITEEHTPHDCRVCYVTMAKEAGMDEYAIKKIVGHVISDLTERVYTKRDFSWLVSEMQKIK